MNEWRKEGHGRWRMNQAKGTLLTVIASSFGGFWFSVDFKLNGRKMECQSDKPYYKTLGGCQRGAVAFAERMGL